MKRASLTVIPAKPKTESPDLTDRLLARDPSASLREAPPRARAGATPPAKRTPPKAATSRPQATPAPKQPAPKRPHAPKLSSDKSSSVPSVLSVDQALTQCRAALDALKAAAGEAPARYDVALRYRLDALAHHIRQIAEYFESAARK